MISARMYYVSYLFYYQKLCINVHLYLWLLFVPWNCIIGEVIEFTNSTYQFNFLNKIKIIDIIIRPKQKYLWLSVVHFLIVVIIYFCVISDLRNLAVFPWKG